LATSAAQVRASTAFQRLDGDRGGPPTRPASPLARAASRRVAACPMHRHINTRRRLPGATPHPAYQARAGPLQHRIQITRGFWMVVVQDNLLPRTADCPAERGDTESSWIIGSRVRRRPGLMLQPFWNPGIKCRSRGKGAIIGFAMSQGPTCYRAILEGLARAARSKESSKARRTASHGQGLRWRSQSDAR